MMIGKTVHNYRIEQLIGEGGMGNVYLATHTLFDRKVAIKSLHPHLSASEELRERFRNEAQTLSQLHHPSIVVLHDYIEQENRAYLIMEYVKGKSLETILEEHGPLRETEIEELMRQILQAVEYAHQQGIIHRDLKPSNIVVMHHNKIKILDFGIAKLLGETNHKLTKTGSKVGTVLYMSPEQINNSNIDNKSDIYALGITLYQMCTGRTPYDDLNSEYEITRHIMEEPFPDPIKVKKDIPPRLRAIILKATHKKPNERYATALEMLNAFSSPKEHQPPPAKKSEKSSGNMTESGDDKSVFRPAIITAAALILGTIIFLIVSKLWSPPEAGHYVLTYQVYLHEQPEKKSPKKELLFFGDPVIPVDNENYANEGISWLHVSAPSGNEGYVPTSFIGDKTRYRLLHKLFREFNLSPSLPLRNKIHLLDYLAENGYIAPADSNTVFTLPEGSKEGDLFAKPDLDGNGQADFACLLENSEKKSCKIVIFLYLSDGAANCFLDRDFPRGTTLQAISPLNYPDSLFWLGKEESVMQADGTLQTHQVRQRLTGDALIIKSLSNTELYLIHFNADTEKFEVTPQNNP